MNDLNEDNNYQNDFLIKDFIMKEFLFEGLNIVYIPEAKLLFACNNLILPIENHPYLEIKGLIINSLKYIKEENVETKKIIKRIIKKIIEGDSNIQYRFYAKFTNHIIIG